MKQEDINDLLTGPTKFKCICRGFYVDPRCPQHGALSDINLDQEFWEQIKRAAAKSTWVPKEYLMNDWVSDVCKFLVEGNNPRKVKN